VAETEHIGKVVMEKLSVSVVVLEVAPHARIGSDFPSPFMALMTNS
jgi:hypothetical protein